MTDTITSCPSESPCVTFKVLLWKGNRNFSFMLLIYICHCQQYKVKLGLHVKCLEFLSDFKTIWIFLTNIDKSFHHKIPHRSIQWDPKLKHAGRWMDRHTRLSPLARRVTLQMCLKNSKQDTVKCDIYTEVHRA